MQKKSDFKWKYIVSIDSNICLINLESKLAHGQRMKSDMILTEIESIQHEHYEDWIHSLC